MEHYKIASDFEVSRIIKGGWQLSAGHSDRISNDPLQDMYDFLDVGIDTFDCADIYTGVEALIGSFINDKRKRDNHKPIKVLTKYVPDYNQLGKLNKADVERIIDRSLLRMNLEQLDMVQFSWWNYEIPGWLEAWVWLGDLQKSGKINLVSTTNFNTAAIKKMIDTGLTPATCQVQYSLLDNRPEKELVDLCKQHNMHLLCYGSVAGGFLSEKWLGMAEPMPPYENRSLTKYKLIIDEIGGWDIFQELLRVLKNIAVQKQVDLTTIALRYMLDQPAVAALIVGARNSSHVTELLQVNDCMLNDADKAAIDAVRRQMNSPPGDVFDMERIKDGPHGSIMKYNLNEA